MTLEDSPRPGYVSNPSEAAPGGPALRRIPGGDFARLWQAEVPKIVERHEAERLQVRRILGLIG